MQDLETIAKNNVIFSNKLINLLSMEFLKL